MFQFDSILSLYLLPSTTTESSSSSTIEPSIATLCAVSTVARHNSSAVIAQRMIRNRLIITEDFTEWIWLRICILHWFHLFLILTEKVLLLLLLLRGFLSLRTIDSRLKFLHGIRGCFIHGPHHTIIGCWSLEGGGGSALCLHRSTLPVTTLLISSRSWFLL